jgi:hypothetical protein
MHFMFTFMVRYSERTIMHSIALWYLLWSPKESPRIFVPSSLTKRLLAPLRNFLVLVLFYSWSLGKFTFIFDTYDYDHILMFTHIFTRCNVVIEKREPDSAPGRRQGRRNRERERVYYDYDEILVLACSTAMPDARDMERRG